MSQGWIKLHRQILDNAIARKPMYAWLWTTLLLMANHEDNEFIWNGEKRICKAGQVLTGRDALSLQTGIPSTSIERILNYLENEHQIGQQKTSKFRLITIIKWSEYQILDIKTDNKRTTDGQQTDTNKNDNNDKNEKNIHVAEATTRITTISESDKCHAIMLSEYVSQHNPAFSQKNGDPKKFRGLDKWAEDIEKMKRIDRVEDRQIEFVIKWLSESQSESASFWRKNILSASTLRKQWQKLVAAIKYEHEKANRLSSKVGIIE